MQINIPREYFLDEVRDGFFVPSIMKKAWAVGLCAYKQLETICDRLEIPLFFISGNLLGAIRHKGCVPWDDDIDVGMLREDYQKLLKYIEENDLPGDYQLRDYTIMKTDNLVRKWMDDRNPVKNIEKWKNYHGFPFVGVVDIVLIDYLPEGKEAIQRYKDNLDIIQEVKDYADKKEANQKYNHRRYQEALFALEKLTGETYDEHRDGKLSVWAWKMLDTYCGSFGPDTCKVVVLLVYYLLHGAKPVPDDYVKNCIDMPFEFTTVRVPAGYDRYLKNFFGNYMYPVLDGSAHAYPYYRRLEEALADNYGIELLKYVYEADTVEEVLSEREKKRTVKEQLTEALGLFCDAHRFILEWEHANEDTSELSEVLSTCQELAVWIGEMIERRITDTADIIHTFEEYCESVYEVFSAVCEGDLTKVRQDDLKEVLGGLERVIDDFLQASNEIKERKEVLFLATTPKDWESLHTIWEAAMRDEEYSVTVVSVPYYYRDGEGRIDPNEMVIHNEGYPEDVFIMDYSTYDVPGVHPDVIVMQCPYDEFSDIIMTDPGFHAKNLVKYTDKLVLVPAFKLSEIADDDERSRYTLARYVRNPGFVYADEIIVQSRGIKKVFVELLNDMTTHINWEAKMLPIGTAIDDWKYEKRNSGDNVKNVVYYLSPGIVYEYGESVIVDSRDILMYINNEYSDRVRVVWRLDEITERVLDEYHPGVRNVYKSVQEEVGACACDGIDRIDGYIGDGSHEYLTCTLEGVPALLLEREKRFDRERIDTFINRLMEAAPRNSVSFGSRIWETIATVDTD
ncbi:MAG: LicD family protein [Eubacterium sp.]|nr:LicD family protein [Eubacterium sp.]